MDYFYETTLFDTKDGIHWKTLSNDHPRGRVLARPKYVPQDKIGAMGMHSRFLFGKAMTRYNPFAPQNILKKYLTAFKKAYLDYLYWSPAHKNWFFAVPKKNIVKVHDAKGGLQELLRLKPDELDNYLVLVEKLIRFLERSGVKTNAMGITNSTLLGNYTFGRSDIDIVIFGIKNGWNIFKFLERNKHPLLKWKSETEWRAYYKDHKSLSGHFTEDDFVRHSIRKKNEGLFGKHVFTLFCVDKPQKPNLAWNTLSYTPLGNAVIKGTVTNDRESIVRPATYEIGKSEIIQSDKNIKNLRIKKIISYPLQFLLQAKKGEKIIAEGTLERVRTPNGESYGQLVIGYPSIGDKRAGAGYLKKKNVSS